MNKFLLHLSFDLDGGDPGDYPPLRKALRKVGFRDRGTIRGTVKDLPNNTFYCIYNGTPGEKPTAVRASYYSKIEDAFSALSLNGPVFLTVAQHPWGVELESIGDLELDEDDLDS